MQQAVLEGGYMKDRSAKQSNCKVQNTIGVLPSTNDMLCTIVPQPTKTIKMQCCQLKEHIYHFQCSRCRRQCIKLNLRSAHISISAYQQHMQWTVQHTVDPSLVDGLLDALVDATSDKLDQCIAMRMQMIITIPLQCIKIDFEIKSLQHALQKW